MCEYLAPGWNGTTLKGIAHREPDLRPSWLWKGLNMDELIAQFEKNATEVVRVSLTEYRKRKLVDVRVYYSDDEGQYRPTKKGVSLSLEVYPDFKRALEALEKILLERDLISPEELADIPAVEVDEGR
jgi:phosphoglycolate phosphatase-like HAD superfamily hydrolase